ncbi:hypothetical protein X764_31630 [Mesorhizobium sp. LSHC440A00]|nr:hypothetical protein X764_31630 [Mesorhizobium sp. LSHC440A00]
MLLRLQRKLLKHNLGAIVRRNFCKIDTNVFGSITGGR